MATVSIKALTTIICVLVYSYLRRGQCVSWHVDSTRHCFISSSRDLPSFTHLSITCILSSFSSRWWWWE